MLMVTNAIVIIMMLSVEESFSCRLTFSPLGELVNAAMFFTCSDATAYYNAHFGESRGPYHLDKVNCNGYETNLLSCSRDNTSGGVHNSGIDVHKLCTWGGGWSQV